MYVNIVGKKENNKMFNNINSLQKIAGISLIFCKIFNIISAVFIISQILSFAKIFLFIGIIFLLITIICSVYDWNKQNQNYKI